MSRERELLEKWRELPSDKQQQVLQFVETLGKLKQPEPTELEKRLRQIRNKIVASDEPLLNLEEIQREARVGK